MKLPPMSSRRFSALANPLSCPSLPALLVSLLLSISLPLVYIIHPSTQIFPDVVRPSALPILTLSFGKMASSDTAFLEHNCDLIRTTSIHRYIIYTDNLISPLCDHCECRKFVPIDCPCPSPGSPACNHCEKLHFLAERLKEMPQLLFLDSDLIILKTSFLSRLTARTAVTDALAAAGHAHANASRYYGNFNSGLLFMRRLEDLDYEEMFRDMYDKKRNSDQGFISEFIFRHYKNWDTLSLKWHCRFLRRGGYDIPPSECYTLHDRKEGPGILKELNFTLRKLPLT